MNKLLFLSVLLFTSIPTFGQWDVVSSVTRNTPIPAIYYDNEIAIAGADSFVFTSTDHGITWLRSGRIGDADYINTAVKYKDMIFVGTMSKGVYFSTDGDKNWNPLNTGFSGNGSDAIKKLEIRGDSLYAGTIGAGIFILDLNNPSAWTHFSNGLSSNFSYSIYSLKNINNRLFSGAGISGIYYVNEKNSSYWDDYNLTNFNSMVIYDFASYNRYIFMAAALGIFRSEDQGATFALTYHGIGATDEGNIVISDSSIYLAFAKGSNTFWFKSDDFGKSINMIEDQPGVTVLSTALIGDKLFAGRSDGLWFKDLKTTSIDRKPNRVNFILRQNYPNPFNPTTSISFNLPGMSFVTLKVFDLTGREVATIVNETLPEGNHIRQWNAAGIASGVYLYRLQAGSFTETKKLVLIR